MNSPKPPTMTHSARAPATGRWPQRNTAPSLAVKLPQTKPGGGRKRSGSTGCRVAPATGEIGNTARAIPSGKPGLLNMLRPDACAAGHVLVRLIATEDGRAEAAPSGKLPRRSDNLSLWRGGPLAKRAVGEGLAAAEPSPQPLSQRERGVRTAAYA